MPVQSRLSSSREFWVWSVGSLLSLLLTVGAYQKWVPLSPIDVLGFVTGAAGVYLTVRQNIWNFPIGLANNLFFFALFYSSRLYFDMSLQVVYFVLGVLGWIWWARGGRDSEAQKTELPVVHSDRLTLVVLAVLIVIGTLWMRWYSMRIGGASPLWDGLTTSLSLAAQYLLSRKYLENWALWFVADLIYVPLYFYRELWLTGVLYFGFLCLCVMGWREWKLAMTKAEVVVA